MDESGFLRSTTKDPKLVCHNLDLRDKESIHERKALPTKAFTSSDNDESAEGEDLRNSGMETEMKMIEADHDDEHDQTKEDESEPVGSC